MNSCACFIITRITNHAIAGIVIGRAFEGADQVLADWLAFGHTAGVAADFEVECRTAFSIDEIREGLARKASA